MIWMGWRRPLVLYMSGQRLAEEALRRDRLSGRWKELPHSQCMLLPRTWNKLYKWLLNNLRCRLALFWAHRLTCTRKYNITDNRTT